MNVLSLFSGAGGMDRGLDAAGMDIVGMCEIDPTARSVLARHWPDTPIHDDVTTLDPEEFRGRVDLVAGGSPCQDLSVAGRRGGLDGSRSGLFWHQCRIADAVAAPWVLWENVAGAFSSNDGADFAAVLWGLTGTLPDVSDGGWRTAGVVVGPKRTAVWRLLDARWFGVAQRRRRVFVVAGPRGQCRPEVLLEPEGVRGNPAPGREAGEGATGKPSPCSDKHRRDEFVGSLTAMDGWERPDNAHAETGWLIPEHVGTITANWHKGPGNTQVEEGCCIPVALHPTQDPISSPDVRHALGTGSATGTATAAVLAVSENQRGELRLTPYARQLTTGGGKPGQGYPAVLADLAVRRLTPRECERLMGWPDDWTRYRADGTEIADSHRYRMCGNGVVAPVAEWIGRRIEEAHG